MDLDIDTARLRPGLRGRPRNLRACAGCGRISIATRCDDCKLERGTRQQRGYDVDHDRLRAELDVDVQTGRVRCAHPDCGELIKPGEPWHLGHNADRTGYLGPMHQRCNCATAKAAA